jgi:hypothetical protein
MEAARSNGSVAGLGCQFGQVHFGACMLGDQRLVKRAVTTADALLRHPGGTLPQKLGRKELLGFYDLANNPKTNHQNMIEGHLQHTRMMAEACAGVVLFIHDTTEADYSGLSIDDLGSLGSGHTRGLLLHNVLAVEYAGRQVLGLAGQLVHCRRRAPRNESRKARLEHPGRESRLWVRGVETVGGVPAGKRWVNLMDRGGDNFESLERQEKLGQCYVVRSRVNRHIQVQDVLGRKRRAKLHHYARKLPRLGNRTLSVASQENQPAREAKVAVAAGAVRLLAPQVKRGQYWVEALDVWVVHVKETDAPKGVEPLEWILLSNVLTQTRDQAWERVDWYQCRPIVEELHKAQKTGCGMELPQFTTRKALEVTIAMLSVVAVQLLRLRDLSRREDATTRRADEVIDPRYVEVLSLWRFKEARRGLSVRDFLHALGRLGGHLGRTHDRPPGWLVLWRGWMELQRLVEGAQLMRLTRSG